VRENIKELTIPREILRSIRLAFTKHRMVTTVIKTLIFNMQKPILPVLPKFVQKMRGWCVSAASPI